MRSSHFRHCYTSWMIHGAFSNPLNPCSCVHRADIIGYPFISSITFSIGGTEPGGVPISSIAILVGWYTGTSVTPCSCAHRANIIGYPFISRQPHDHLNHLSPLLSMLFSISNQNLQKLLLTLLHLFHANHRLFCHGSLLKPCQIIVLYRLV